MSAVSEGLRRLIRNDQSMPCTHSHGSGIGLVGICGREMLLFTALDVHVSHFDLGGGFGVPTVRNHCNKIAATAPILRGADN